MHRKSPQRLGWPSSGWRTRPLTLLTAINACAGLGIATSTLARRRHRGTLGRGESERVYRLARLFARAVSVFGEAERARAWLKKPQYALGGQEPLAYADTEPGAREVERLLGRIEHGIPA